MHLLFDYDGTLHETMRIYGPAFRMACEDLAARGLIEPRHDSDAEIAVWLGFSTPEMWRRFLPELPQPEKERSSRMIGGEMLRLVRAGQAALYPQAEATLAALKARGHTLILLSNCRRAYLQAHVQTFGLDRFFTACYCCEEFGDIPKYDSFPKIRALAGRLCCHRRPLFRSGGCGAARSAVRRLPVRLWKRGGAIRRNVPDHVPAGTADDAVCLNTQPAARRKPGGRLCAM